MIAIFRFRRSWTDCKICGKDPMARNNVAVFDAALSKIAIKYSYDGYTSKTL